MIDATRSITTNSEICDAYADGYRKGYEDAKQKFIDKTCEYLDNVLYEVVSGISCLPDVMSIENTTMEDFIKNFRKVMEE